ncbi:GNAT family N-acetyltransferase [Undibacterium sp. TJN19]|uniref:GNAT family N-acetyltransferase n=1 Tax=Undibacterium sp. TJN19 TaxID=3413055 RepID=UPI003BF152DF
MAIITLEQVVEDDADLLADLRVLAMRESLERIGRFDAQRARQRLLTDFSAGWTRHIICELQRVGFVVVKPKADDLLLDHLYLHPDFQGGGIGAATLAILFAEADAQGKILHVGALRESVANHFYVRHGFVLCEQAQYDNYYIRQPQKGG